MTKVNTGIYFLTNSSRNYLETDQIAMAPKISRVKDDNGEDRDQIMFLCPNDVNLGHTFVGNMTESGNGRFSIEDSEKIGDDGEPVIWQFSPLTLALWNKMGERGQIVGWNQHKDSIPTDEALINMYHVDWLDSCADWWFDEPNDDLLSEVPSASE